MDLLYPPFLGALLDLQMECKLLGSPYKVYSGHRQFDEQRQLYYKYLDGGPKAAPPGLSAHNYGMAVDCALLLPDGKLSWLGEHYETLEKTAEKHGLVTGKAFGDRPHVQVPNYVTGTQLWPLKTVYNRTPGTELEKLKAVWNVVESR